MTSLPASSSEDRSETGGLRIEPQLVKMPDEASQTASDPAAESDQALQKPAAQKPAAQKPAAKKTPAKKPAATKSAATKPAATKPAAAKPAATKPAAAKPAAKKPTVTKTAATKSDATESATTKPAAKAAPRKPAAKTPTKTPAAEKQKTTAAGRKPAAPRAPRVTKPETPVPAPPPAKIVVSVTGLVKRFGNNVAVDGIDIVVREGSFYGILGPNGAGKTTTLSMITGMLRPDAGTITVHDVDVWAQPALAKRSMGILPDQLRLFDRLTGAQMLHYAGALRGLDTKLIRSRSADLANAFGLEDALGRLVADYSAGMTKKIALAAAMIHAPRLLVLDEPFESVDAVSAANVVEILRKYVAKGGTVLLSSHGMELIERICDHVAIVVEGKVLAAGALDAVRDGRSLEERFVEFTGGRSATEDAEWLHSFSD